LFPQHIILGQAQKDVAGLNKFCESSCLYLCKHYTTEKRQIQIKRRPESIEHWYMRACVRVCVWLCLIIILCLLYVYIRYTLG